VGRLSLHGVVYLVLNLVGAAVLAVDAYIEALWGFLLLESVWALVAAASLTRVLRRDAPGTE